MSLTIGKGIKLYKGLSIGKEDHGEIVDTRYFVIQNILHRIKHRGDDTYSFPYSYDTLKFIDVDSSWVAYTDYGWYKVFQKSSALKNLSYHWFKLTQPIYANTTSVVGHGGCLIDATVNFYQDSYREIIIDNSQTGFYSKQNNYYENIISTMLNNQ